VAPAPPNGLHQPTCWLALLSWQEGVCSESQGCPQRAMSSPHTSCRVWRGCPACQGINGIHQPPHPCSNTHSIDSLSLHTHQAGAPGQREVLWAPLAHVASPGAPGMRRGGTGWALSSALDEQGGDEALMPLTTTPGESMWLCHWCGHLCWARASTIHPHPFNPPSHQASVAPKAKKCASLGM
jgi:hypothetical protein